MKLIGVDVETFLIQPGMLAPRLVCATFSDGVKGSLLDHKQGPEALGDLLLSRDSILIAHNAPFDFGVFAVERPSLLKEIFKGYDSGRIRDTKIRAQLIDIANGDFSTNGHPRFYKNLEGKNVKIGYSLADLSLRYLNRFLPKADTWRLRYGELYGIPLDEWPDAAKNYAMDDAIVALDLYNKQIEVAAATFQNGDIADEIAQHCASWALHLMSMWGMRTDAEAVAKLKTRLVAELAEHDSVLRRVGFIRENGSKDMKVIRAKVEEAFGKLGQDVPLTEGGAICTDADALKDSGDPTLIALHSRAAVEKILSTYVPALLLGTNIPICANYQTLVESGRTSCAGPNMQNLPRGGDVRACFIPRPGWVFVSADYDTAELRALAEACLALCGHSAMAEALQRGEDLHLVLAAELLGVSYQEALSLYEQGDENVSNYRQFSKVKNFGGMGGLGDEGFVAYAKGYGINISLEFAGVLTTAWFRRFPEMRKYFSIIKGVVGPMNSGTITQIGSGRIRGNVGFTQAANSFPQGLVADIAKAALYEVSRSCYVERSALFGARPVGFYHDEIQIEAREEQSAAAATLLAEIMKNEMQKRLPNVPAACTPVITRRFYKGAKPVYVDGKLVPSRPEKKDGKVKWVADG